MHIKKPRKKPSFYVRLSSLIVIQVVFVFVVLALLLFYPVDRASSDIEFEKDRDRVVELAGQIENLVNSPEDFQGSVFSAMQSEALTEVLENDRTFHAVSVIGVDSTGQVQLMYSYNRSDSDYDCELEPGTNLQSTLDTGFVRYAIHRPVGSISNLSLSSQHSVFYYHLANTFTGPALMVSVVDHDLFISDRSSLMYICFVLFLVSTLVSLLIVYLIRVRVKRPLARLLRGLEKTTEGELYYMIATEDDEELNTLTTAFNRMTRTLWENQRALKEYNAGLKEINWSLLQSQLFLSTLIDSSPFSIVVSSPTGRIMLFSRKAAETFGYDQSEAVGLPLTDLFVLPSGQSNPVPSAEDDSPGHEARCRRSDGSSFPSFVVSTRVDCGNDNMAHICIIRDISESKGFLDMMIRLDRYYTRGEMVGDIAHEINNYLAILGGNVELIPLIMRRGQQEKLEKKLQLMKETVDKIARFTDGLMDVPQDQVVLDKLDLNQLVENVLAFLKPQNRFDRISIETSLSTELPLVQLDAGQIQQLLTNLLFNAAEALNEIEGEKTIMLETAVVDLEEGQHARLAVIDTGPGVPEEHLSKLFVQRFTTKRRGHGIGLITCRRIVDGHSGRIAYEYSGGAHFLVDIPLQLKTDEAREESQRAEATS